MTGTDGIACRPSFPNSTTSTILLFDLHSLAFNQLRIQYFPYRILSLTPTQSPRIDSPRRVQFLQQVTTTNFFTSLTHGYQPQPSAFTFHYHINASSASSTNHRYRHQPQFSAYRCIERKLHEPHEPAPTPDISICISHIEASSASTIHFFPHHVLQISNNHSSPKILHAIMTSQILHPPFQNPFPQKRKYNHCFTPAKSPPFTPNLIIKSHTPTYKKQGDGGSGRQGNPHRCLSKGSLEALGVLLNSLQHAPFPSFDVSILCRPKHAACTWAPCLPWNPFAPVAHYRHYCVSHQNHAYIILGFTV